MATAVTYNGTNYSVPSAGELNWADLDLLLIDLANTANPSSTQKTSTTTAAGATVSVVLTDRTILCTHTATAPVTVNLPAGVDGQVFVVKDAGLNASVNAITIAPNGTDTIEGEASLGISTDGGFAEVQYDSDSAQWKIVSASVEPSGVAATASFTKATVTRKAVVGAAGYGLHVEVPFATGAVSGTMSTTTQTLAGAKTWSGNAVFQAQLDQVYDMGVTGWQAYTGASPYFTVSGTTFTLNSAGTGRINGVPITWAGGQSVTLTAKSGHWIYIDTAGTLGVQTSTPTLIHYQTRIYLYEDYYDGTNHITVRENHPYDFMVHVSAFLHNNAGIVVRNTSGDGATISRVATGTGASADDRRVKITADTLEDHGLETTIASNTTGISFLVFYTDAAGDWIQYGSAVTEFPMFTNVAGTVSALDTGPNDDCGVFTLYVTKNNGNTGTTAQYIAVMDRVANAGARFDSPTAAVSAISAGTTQRATGALLALELAQLGHVVVQNNATSGYVERVIVEKSTFNTRLVGGGAGSTGALVSLNTSLFGGVLSAADGNVQAAMDTLDDHLHTGVYAPAAQGVTNGNTHDHAGGDGGQIDHTGLSNIGTLSHSTIDTYLDQSVKTTGAPTFVSVKVTAGTASASTITYASGAFQFGQDTSVKSTISDSGIATFTQYTLTPIVHGSSTASGSLTLSSTSNATKGSVYIGAAGAVATFAPTAITLAQAVTCSANAQHTFGAVGGADAQTVLAVIAGGTTRRAITYLQANSKFFQTDLNADGSVSMYDGNTVGKYATITTGGAWTWGEAGVALLHTANGVGIRVTGPSSAGYLLVSRASAGGFGFATLGSGGAEIYGSNDETNPSKTVVGSWSAIGSWAFGTSSSGDGVVHVLTANRADYGVGVFNLSTNGSAVSLRLGSALTSGSNVLMDYKDGSNTTCGYVTIDTTANTVTYTNTSDGRLKHKETTFEALSIVCSCPVYEYERICNPGTKERGYIAQRTQEWMPECVSVGGDDPNENPWGVDYGRVTPYLHRAIQQLNEKIMEIEKRIAA